MNSTIQQQLLGTALLCSRIARYAVLSVMYFWFFFAVGEEGYFPKATCILSVSLCAYCMLLYNDLFISVPKDF